MVGSLKGVKGFPAIHRNDFLSSWFPPQAPGSHPRPKSILLQIAALLLTPRFSGISAMQEFRIHTNNCESFFASV